MHEVLKEKLQQNFTAMQETHRFKPGDLVRWKPGLKSSRFPEYGEPVIVLDVLETVVLPPEKDHGPPFFREPLDFVYGTVRPDGEFFAYHSDSRRFEPYADPSAPTENAIDG